MSNEIDFKQIYLELNGLRDQLFNAMTYVDGLMETVGPMIEGNASGGKVEFPDVVLVPFDQRDVENEVCTVVMKRDGLSESEEYVLDAIVGWSKDVSDEVREYVSNAIDKRLYRFLIHPSEESNHSSYLYSIEFRVLSKVKNKEDTNDVVELQPEPMRLAGDIDPAIVNYSIPVDIVFDEKLGKYNVVKGSKKNSQYRLVRFIDSILPEIDSTANELKSFASGNLGLYNWVCVITNYHVGTTHNSTRTIVNDFVDMSDIDASYLQDITNVIVRKYSASMLVLIKNNV